MWPLDCEVAVELIDHDGDERKGESRTELLLSREAEREESGGQATEGDRVGQVQQKGVDAFSGSGAVFGIRVQGLAPCLGNL